MSVFPWAGSAKHPGAESQSKLPSPQTQASGQNSCGKFSRSGKAVSNEGRIPLTTPLKDKLRAQNSALPLTPNAQGEMEPASSQAKKLYIGFKVSLLLQS